MYSEGKRNVNEVVKVIMKWTNNEEVNDLKFLPNVQMSYAKSVYLTHKTISEMCCKSLNRESRHE